MESILKPLRDGESVLDLSPRSTVSGGVEDVYGEDHATEDQLITPWNFSVARSISLSTLFNLCFLVCTLSVFLASWLQIIVCTLLDCEIVCKIVCDT